MQYKEYLRLEQERQHCGFCDVDGDHIVRDGGPAYVTPALAPYGEYHLLICPRRHVESILDLDQQEKQQMMNLLLSTVQQFYSMGIQEVVTLVRDSHSFDDGGVGRSTSGKSRKHFHIHVVGDVQIMPRMTQESSDSRRILTSEEMTERTQQFRIG